jgi:hypothetical protein
LLEKNGGSLTVLLTRVSQSANLRKFGGLVHTKYLVGSHFILEVTMTNLYIPPENTGSYYGRYTSISNGLEAVVGTDRFPVEEVFKVLTVQGDPVRTDDKATLETLRRNLSVGAFRMDSGADVEFHKFSGYVKWNEYVIEWTWRSVIDVWEIAIYFPNCTPEIRQWAESVGHPST